MQEKNYVVVTYKDEGKELRFPGELVGINESEGTVDVRFHDGVVENGIPVEYITEGVGEFFSKIKGSLESAWEKIKTVGNKIYIYVKDKLVNAVLPINIAVDIKNGDYPFANIILPESNIAFAKQQGVDINNPSVDDMLTDDDEDSNKAINTFWLNVMENYKQAQAEGKMQTLTECYHETVKARDKALLDMGYISEEANKLFENVNDRNSTAINPANMEEFASGRTYGLKDFTAEEIKEALFDSVEFWQRWETSEIDKGTLDAYAPMLIWGAPGIGKTSIVKDMIRAVNEDPYFGGKIGLMSVDLKDKRSDDFTLPTTDEERNEFFGKQVHDTPKSWLPMYQIAKASDMDLTGKTPEEISEVEAEIKEINDTRNKAVNSVLGDGSEGGIIFIDEFSRLKEDVIGMLMTLLQSRELNGYTIGSKWFFVVAANRPGDMMSTAYESQARFVYDKAIAGRFRHYNYKLTFEKWLEWAEGIGQNGKPRVLPIIIDFLKKYQHVWYIVDDPSHAAGEFLTTTEPRSWGIISSTHYGDIIIATQDLLIDSKRNTMIDDYEKENNVDINTLPKEERNSLIREFTKNAKDLVLNQKAYTKEEYDAAYKEAENSSKLFKKLQNTIVTSTDIRVGDEFGKYLSFGIEFNQEEIEKIWTDPLNAKLLRITNTSSINQLINGIVKFKPVDPKTGKKRFTVDDMFKLSQYIERYGTTTSSVSTMLNRIAFGLAGEIKEEMGVNDLRKPFEEANKPVDKTKWRKFSEISQDPDFKNSHWITLSPEDVSSLFNDYYIEPLTKLNKMNRDIIKSWGDSIKSMLADE